MRLLQSDDGFFNIVNGEEADTSDSEGELEESDNEIEEQLVENNAGDEEQSETDDEEETDEENEEETDEDDEGSVQNSSSDEEEEEEADEKPEEANRQLNDASSDSETETKIIEKVRRKPAKTTATVKPSISLDSGIDKQNDDEYAEHDTSDEEDIRNTVGNIPMNWYDEYKHLGYDWDGKPIVKPPAGDQLDAFLQKVEDPDFWRTVKDPQTGQDVVLSEEDIQTIRRIQGQKIPDVSFDEYAVRNFVNLIHILHTGC